MKILIIAALCGAIALSAGCQSTTQAVGTVCAQIAKYQADPAVTGPLDAQDPHSALGVLWADAKSACANGVPAAGASTDWTGLVTQEMLALAPTVIPALAGLL